MIVVMLNIGAALGLVCAWSMDATMSAHVQAPAAPPAARPAARMPLAFAWPTTGRRIVEGYGARRNTATGTVTINPGINIAAQPGSPVTASETGVVTAVSWVPSYGTVVIVQHRDGYRTVYGKLAASAVAKGAGVQRGAKVGTVSGSMLHFEMWRGKTRLDPTKTLARK